MREGLFSLFMNSADFCCLETGVGTDWNGFEICCTIYGKFDLAKVLMRGSIADMGLIVLKERLGMLKP